MPRPLRIILLALTIAATLGVSAASASHFDASPNGCGICFAAHTVAFETPSMQLLCGPELVGLATLVPHVSGYKACTDRTFSSRGPPPFSC